MKTGTPSNRYPYDSILQERRSLRYLLKLLRPQSGWADVLWLLGTLGIIGACVALGWYESVRSTQ